MGTRPFVSYVMIAIAVCYAGDINGGEMPKNDELIGEWETMGFFLNEGINNREMAVPTVSITKTAIIFRADAKGEDSSYSYVIDSTRSPKTIDLEFLTGFFKGGKVQGIFKLESDKLTICIPLYPADLPMKRKRPQVFEPNADFLLAVMILKRIAPKKGMPGIDSNELHYNETTVGSPTLTISNLYENRRIKTRGFLGNILRLRQERFRLLSTNIVDEPDKELQALEGAWTIVKANVDGRLVDKSKFVGSKYIFEKDKLTIVENGEAEYMGDIILNSQKSPKWMDVNIQSGINKGKKSLGIYQVEGNKLVLCHRPPDGDRPIDFSSRNLASLLTLEKVK